MPTCVISIVKVMEESVKKSKMWSHKPHYSQAKGLITGLLHNDVISPDLHYVHSESLRLGRTHLHNPISMKKLAPNRNTDHTFLSENSVIYTENVKTTLQLRKNKTVTL